MKLFVLRKPINGSLLEPEELGLYLIYDKAGTPVTVVRHEIQSNGESTWRDMYKISLSWQEFLHSWCGRGETYFLQSLSDHDREFSSVAWEQGLRYGESSHSYGSAEHANPYLNGTYN